MSIRIHPGSLTERVLDRLSTEGGWMTTSLIYDYFPDTPINSIQQTLKRLRAKGMVEARSVREQTEWAGNPENEWRVHPDAEW